MRGLSQAGPGWRIWAVRILAALAGAVVFTAGVLLALDVISLRLLLAQIGGLTLALPAAKLHAKVLALFAHRGAQALELALALAGLGLVFAALLTAFRLNRPPR
jgi:hypothetical protein